MKTTLFIAFVNLLFFLCTKDRLVADGNLITEVRNPGTFPGVLGSGHNPIKITYGSAPAKVEIKGSGNLLPRYKTTIYNGILNLGYEFVNVHHDDIEVFVTMPEITSASMSGSGKLEINADFPTQSLFRLTISGSSKTNINIIQILPWRVERLQKSSAPVRTKLFSNETKGCLGWSAGITLF